MFTSDVNFRTRYYLAFAVLALGFLLSSCEEKISTIGSSYVKDSVIRGVTSYTDSVLKLQSVLKQTVFTDGVRYTLSKNSPYLFFGSVPSENLEAWAALKFPFLPDSVGAVLDDSLILTFRTAYFYGPDPSDATLDFYIYTETGHRATDSTASLALSDLSAQPIYHYTGSVLKDTTTYIAIHLDTAILNPLLRTTSLALVIVPGPTMKSVRAFASTDDGNTANEPRLQMLIQGSANNYLISRYPDYDFHLVADGYTPPAGMFELRGSKAQRERIAVSVKDIRERLGLNSFTTINKATLDFVIDGSLTATGVVPQDSTYPLLFFRGYHEVDDSTFGLEILPTLTGSTMSYSIQSYVEYAIRHSLDSLTFDMVAGYATRTFGLHNAIVEDYNVNRWVVYSSDAIDPTKRPKFTILYSNLK